MITKNEFYEQLKSRAYAQISHGISQQEIGDAMASFMAFLTLPDEIKTHIDLKISEKHRRGDVGYKRRLAKGDIYGDNKEFFHYHPALLAEYPDFIQKHPVVQNFVNHAQPLWVKITDRIKQILNYFEEDYPGVMAQIFDRENPHILLRFLRYEWASSGKYLAKPHYDAGSFTFALSEDTAGLRIGTCPDNLEAVTHKEGHGLFFVSSNYGKLLPEEDFKAAWHDVIQLDESKIGRPYSRWAMVAFVEADVEALPRSETHKFYKVA